MFIKKLGLTFGSFGSCFYHELAEETGKIRECEDIAWIKFRRGKKHKCLRELTGYKQASIFYELYKSFYLEVKSQTDICAGKEENGFLVVEVKPEAGSQNNVIVCFNLLF